MKIEGNNKCFQCGNQIKWHSYTTKSDVRFGIMDSEEVDAIAVGTYISSSGKAVRYEVIVECKHCGIKNKFEK